VVRDTELEREEVIEVGGAAEATRRTEDDNIPRQENVMTVGLGGWEWER